MESLQVPNVCEHGWYTTGMGYGIDETVKVAEDGKQGLPLQVLSPACLSMGFQSTCRTSAFGANGGASSGWKMNKYDNTSRIQAWRP
eukprot:688280-Amphidinium_carterae.3